MTVYKESTKVQWDWGTGTATGRIETVYTEKVTRKIKGAEVTRNASQARRRRWRVKIPFRSEKGIICFKMSKAFRRSKVL